LSWILLGGQGVFCFNYNVKCFKFKQDKGVDTKECAEWNPYFSNELYMKDDEIKSWTTLGLSDSDFNKAALDDMKCEMDIRKTKKDHEHVCTEAELKASTFKPQNQVAYTETQKISHFTFVFNIFVFLQVFNIINSRKIEGELNVFSEFFNNWLFVFVIILTFAVQIFIVEYGSMATKCHALTMKENLVCIGMGFSSLIWGFFLKFLPVGLFQWVSLDEKPMTAEQAEQSFVSKVKSVRGGKAAPRTENVIKFENAFADKFKGQLGGLGAFAKKTEQE